MTIENARNHTVGLSSPLSNRSKEIISGLSAGLATTLITHPLDLLKVRLQLDSQSKNSWSGIKTIVKDINASVLKEHTQNPHISKSSLIIRNMYRGLFTNAVGNVTAWGFYFMLYREFKDLSYTHLTSQRDSNHSYMIKKDKTLNSGHYLLSSFAAGLSTSLLTNPIWVLKTRIISTQKSEPGAYQSLWDGTRRIFKEEGILAFWKGLTPSLFGVLQSALQFTIYDTLKYHIVQKYNSHGDTSKDSELSTFQYIYTSATSKIISTTMLYPAQVLKSRLQAFKSNTNPETTMRALSRNILSKEGIPGFYKGLIPNLIRVVPATCVTFVVYEKIRLWL